MKELETVKRLTNDELVARVRHCVREDRRVTAQLLAHLGEIEARGLHRDVGYESMFEYAVRVLHMSDSEAGLRLHAARFARKFPDSLEMLSRGELHLTAMKLLAPVLTQENSELLSLSCLKTKQEIQLLIAKHCPQPDVPDAIRRLPTSRSAKAVATRPDAFTLFADGESTAPDLPSRLADDRTAAPESTPATEARRAGIQTELGSPSGPDALPACMERSPTAPSQPATAANTTSVAGKPTLIAHDPPATRTAGPTFPARSDVDRGAETCECTVGRELAPCSCRVLPRPPHPAPVPHPSNREPALPIS
jgi:hypothetical protein